MIDFGEGVYLDSLDAVEAEKLRCWRNSYSTWAWCRQSDLISQQDQYDWVERQRKDPTIRMYIIRESDGKKMAVGACGLTSINHINGTAEFSLYIAPERRGQGHSRPALKTLVSHGFSNLALNHIFGETFDGNPAAKVFEELGFVREGTRRSFYYKGGKHIDAHLYSILFLEWWQSGLYKKDQTS